MASFYTDLSSRLRRPIFRVANQVKYLAVRSRARFRGAIRHVHGPKDVDCDRDELVVLCLVKNGELWVESFIRHHLELGAKHIFFLDNESSDSTLARARSYDSVSIWSTDLPFKYFEQGMRRWLTRRFGNQRWSLSCDIDELFDYPYSDELDIRGFLQYLNHYSYRAVAAHMLDMFSDQSFSELSSNPEDCLREKYPYFDLADLTERRDLYWIQSGDLQSEEITAMMGGVRKRAFGTEGIMQTKHPLVYADSNVKVYPYDGHFHTGARIADVSAVLLHYKLVSTLKDQAREALQKGHYSRLYRGFYKVLLDNPDLTLGTENSRELREVDQLVDEGFLVASDEYRRWVTNYGKSTSRSGLHPTIH